MKKIKVELSYMSFKFLLDLIGLYIKAYSNLETLILHSLKAKLWKKASEEKVVKMGLEPFQAHAIRSVLLHIPDNLPTAEKNELLNILSMIDKELVSIS